MRHEALTGGTHLSVAAGEKKKARAGIYWLGGLLLGRAYTRAKEKEGGGLMGWARLRV